jgi:hypothetical protein
MEEETKVIEIDARESFAQVVLEHKGERYEGLLMKSSYKKDWEKDHIMKLDDTQAKSGNVG